MNESVARPIRAWELWNNPILARYRRSRLRRRHLLPWALIVLIANAFIVGLLFAASRNTLVPLRDISRLALVLLMVIQSVLLMFLGTGAVAAGIIQESAEGMIDYQRLTPMTPVTKIMGYVLGLPIREYILAGLTMPFIALTAWLGEIAWDALGRFYGVFLMAVLLYHMTGLVAGSVVRKKFVAGRTAQMLVFMLYVVLPRFAHLGFIFLIYLTVLPAWYEQAKPYLPDESLTRWIPGLENQVPWFAWEFGPTLFSLIIQGSLILVFVVILARKWRDAEAHLMANYFAFSVFAAVCLLLLGNAFPLIDRGDFFNTMGDIGDAEFAWATVTLMGTVFLVILLLLSKFITPTLDEARRGFRRATKLQAPRVAPFSDDVTSLWAVIALVIAAVTTWLMFTYKLNESGVWGGHIPSTWPLAFAVSLALPTLTFHAVLERSGGRAALLMILLGWIVPPLAAVVMAASGVLETTAVYTASVSGFLMPIFAVVQLETQAESSTFLATVRPAFWFSIIVYAILVPILVIRLQQYRRGLMRETGFRSH